MKNFGSEPGEYAGLTYEQRADIDIYCLRLAVDNRDEPTLLELWKHYQSWDLPHLKKLVDYIVNLKWGPALTSILKQQATEIVFRSVAPEEQIELVEHWFRLRKAQPNDFFKYFDDGLS